MIYFYLYRFAGQIVVIVDAILLSGDERTKSLNVAAAPAAIELYFFLQAWFQAAPQAIFQTHLLFRERTVERTYQSSNYFLQNIRKKDFINSIVLLI